MNIIRWLIEAVRLDDDTPQTQPQQPQQAKPPARLTIPRKKAENIAANILHYERYKGDVDGKARSMTDEELAELIERFRADAFGD